MRFFLAALFALITAALVTVLDTKLVLPAPLGKLLSPSEGLWQNSDPDSPDKLDFKFKTLQGKVSVYMDDRLVPHVFAEQENDLYFVQGYLHAKFRLFQMELQTMVAEGRAAEWVGEVALEHDREFRRLGMSYAAEVALAEMQKDPKIKATCDAYTAGVNSYIENLSQSELPVEFKLLGVKPEKWTNYRIALFLKIMSFDLAGAESDFEMANAKSFFSAEDFALLYPEKQDSLDPIIPRAEGYMPAAQLPLRPADADSIIPVATNISEVSKPDPGNGSNNWAVAGSKTKSGHPILCNDPHLGLNLPSIWYEIQLSCAEFNAYGVSFPGSPSVIIGFNDHAAFGFTNGGRDVRDYYEIKFQDEKQHAYRYDSAWKPAEKRVEKFYVAGRSEPVLDTVRYTVFGPVMYDRSFRGKAKRRDIDEPRAPSDKAYAVRWKAHDASNELQIFQRLDRAQNLSDYTAAAEYLSVPGQNCVFATKTGDIALRTQGSWPAKWKGQGDFPMPGTSVEYQWQFMIPQGEVPAQYNPERGFVSSANQKPVDESYQYYIGREYPQARGKLINQRLMSMTQITVDDMKAMQTDNFNLYASWLRPVLEQNMDIARLSNAGVKYFNMLHSWNLRNDANSMAATVYEIWYRMFKEAVFDDEYANAPKVINQPVESTLVEALLRDSVYKFIDDIRTPVKEDMREIMTRAFMKASDTLAKIENQDKLQWAKYKNTSVTHMLKLPAFSRSGLQIGGGGNMINATRENHGPSWRMIVELGPETEAWGVYPGGQSGNPGSDFYDNAISDWAAGRYYRLWLMKKEEAGDKRIRYTLNFSKS